MFLLTAAGISSAWPEFALELVGQQPYSQGSIDRALLDAQDLLTPESRSRLYGEAPAQTPGRQGRPRLEQIAASVCEAKQHPLARLLALTRWCNRVPLDYPESGNSTAGGYYRDFAGFRWGGSEESVIAKGSPWPQELARALAVLLQVAGIPSRLVFLYRQEPPLLHALVEAWVQGGWAVSDPCANRCYIWPHHGYASAADLQQQPRLVDQAPEFGRQPHVDSRLFRTIAIAAYALTSEPAPESDLRPARAVDRATLQGAARIFQAP